MGGLKQDKRWVTHEFEMLQTRVGQSEKGIIRLRFPLNFQFLIVSGQLSSIDFIFKVSSFKAPACLFLPLHRQSSCSGDKSNAGLVAAFLRPIFVVYTSVPAFLPNLTLDGASLCRLAKDKVKDRIHWFTALKSESRQHLCRSCVQDWVTKNCKTKLCITFFHSLLPFICSHWSFQRVDFTK